MTSILVFNYSLLASLNSTLYKQKIPSSFEHQNQHIPPYSYTMKSLSMGISTFSLFCTIFVIPSLALQACDYPAIFNFGDSNSDTGAIAAAFTQPGPPNGESFFKRPAGRYSDGRLMIDFLGTYVSSLLPFIVYIKSLKHVFGTFIPV